MASAVRSVGGAVAKAVHTLRVGVVGAGTAGPATALLLAQAGHRISLMDRTPELAPVGAGIGIQPIGMTALSRLGLLRPILEHGQRIDHLIGDTKEGRNVLDVTYSKFDDRLFGVGLHRGVLFMEMIRAAQALAPSDAGDGSSNLESSRGDGTIALHTGVDVVEAITHDDGTVIVTDAQGNQHGPFDLLVVADGTKSHLRDKLHHEHGLAAKRRDYPYGALWAVLPDTDREFSDTRTLAQVYDSAKVMLGFLPTGAEHAAAAPSTTGTAERAAAAAAITPDGSAPSTPSHHQHQVSTVSMFWSLPWREYDDWRARPLEEWKETIVSLQPRAAGLMQHIRSHDDLTLATYSDVVMRRFVSCNIVCIGDNAHATSPQLGQGANLALVDAWKLSQALARHVGEPADGFSSFHDPAPSVRTAPRGEGVEVSTNRRAALANALCEYNANRRWRLWFYQINSGVLTPVFQSDSRIIAALRDAFMGPMCHFPPTRRQMLATLVGALGPNWVTLIPENEYLGFLEDPCMADMTPRGMKTALYASAAGIKE